MSSTWTSARIVSISRIGIHGVICVAIVVVVEITFVLVLTLFLSVIPATYIRVLIVLSLLSLIVVLFLGELLILVVIGLLGRYQQKVTQPCLPTHRGKANEGRWMETYLLICMSIIVLVMRLLLMAHASLCRKQRPATSACQKERLVARAEQRTRRRLSPWVHQREERLTKDHDSACECERQRAT